MAPVVVAAAVVERDGRLLLTRRREGSHLSGYWEFPGGKLEQGESPAEAVMRECLEECGLRVRPRRLLDVVFHRYPERDVLLLFYECQWLAGRVRHLGVAAHAWVRPDELSRFPLPPADEPIVRRLQRRARRRTRPPAAQ
ncbi:MAG: (deoxy)nucleoside triphosphate pyrophosphohydrolase [Myxococcota bacterium]|nr:(deoxy)nucleoside triphosphate pyrophosphohydrolase [Myxococcota bacterium]MDW8363647.1 (deoxy)nucleoside triphosphate pyrophosphohydrolase [Myxococcales bacterium]